MNPYDELGVPTDATPEQINAAYRRKARESHPDAGGDAEAFNRLSIAVAVLRDDERRQRFDQTGSTDEPSRNQRNEAVEVLVQVFQQALAESPIPEIMDVIASTKQKIRTIIQGCNDNRANIQANRSDFEKAMGRLKHKADGPDFIRTAMQANIATMDRALLEVDRRQAIAKEALELADTYRWECDQPTAGSPFMTNATYAYGPSATGFR